MRKLGFTLAEVLITSEIIVVQTAFRKANPAVNARKGKRRKGKDKGTILTTPTNPVQVLQKKEEIFIKPYLKRLQVTHLQPFVILNYT